MRKIEVRKLAGVLIVAVFALFALTRPLLPVSADPLPEPAAAMEKPNYREFPHSAKAHRLDCGTCHKFPSANWKTVRPAAAAFEDITDYPKHDSCVKCHMQQFFKGTPPAICSICHTKPSPRDSSRHPFPNPREIFDLSPKGKKAESDFAVAFPHDKHIEIVSQGRSIQTDFINASFTNAATRLAAEESCSVCHQTQKPQGKSDDEYLTKPPVKLGDAFWLKKGTFKSEPIGHTTCFTCHSTESGILPAPQSCGSCHQLRMPAVPADFDAKLAATMIVDDKVMLDGWRKRSSSGTFRHEFFAHVELSCATCHNVLTMKTAEPRAAMVTVNACATCHATPTSDDGGALNYEVDERKSKPAFECTKCHITFGKQPVPDSHLKAITAAATVK